jgi:excisionase family DNA binding protein
MRTALTGIPACSIAISTRTIAAFEVVLAMAQDGVLDPITEARIRAAFSDRALLTRKAAAALLGIDEKTLTSLVLSGSLPAVNVGKQHRFSEAALRRFIQGETHEGSAAPGRVHGNFSSRLITPISAIPAKHQRPRSKTKRTPPK